MYDTTKVKTFQPVLPVGNGPICESAEDAVRDIITDAYERIWPYAYTDAEVELVTTRFAEAVSDWTPGEYMMLFDEYRIVIKHYARSELDEMPEFNGY